MFIIFAWRMMCINFVGPSFSRPPGGYRGKIHFCLLMPDRKKETSKGYVHKFQLEVWQKKIRHIIKFDHLPTYLVPQLPTTMLRLIWCPQQHSKIHWISIEFTYATNSPTPTHHNIVIQFASCIEQYPIDRYPPVRPWVRHTLLYPFQLGPFCLPEDPI